MPQLQSNQRAVAETPGIRERVVHPFDTAGQPLQPGSLSLQVGFNCLLWVHWHTERKALQELSTNWKAQSFGRPSVLWQQFWGIQTVDAVRFFVNRKAVEICPLSFLSCPHRAPSTGLCPEQRTMLFYDSFGLQGVPFRLVSSLSPDATPLLSSINKNVTL